MPFRPFLRHPNQQTGSAERVPVLSPAALAAFSGSWTARVLAGFVLFVGVVASGCTISPKAPEGKTELAKAIGRKNPAKAVRLLEGAAREDYVPAMIMLGNYQRTGYFHTGVPLNRVARGETPGDGSEWDRRAVETLETQLEANDNDAMLLALLYATGRGTARDTTRACDLVLGPLEKNGNYWMFAQRWCPESRVLRTIERMEAVDNPAAYIVRAHVEYFADPDGGDVVRFMSLLHYGSTAGDTTATDLFQRTRLAISERARTGAAEAVESRERLRAVGLWDVEAGA